MNQGRQGWLLIVGALALGGAWLSSRFVDDEPEIEGFSRDEPTATVALSDEPERTTHPDAGADSSGQAANEAAAREAQRERQRRALAAVNRAREKSGSRDLSQFIHQAATEAQQAEPGVIEITNQGLRAARQVTSRDGFARRRRPAYGLIEEREPDGAPSGSRSLAEILEEAQQELERRQQGHSLRVQALEPRTSRPGEATESE